MSRPAPEALPEWWPEWEARRKGLYESRSAALSVTDGGAVRTNPRLDVETRIGVYEEYRGRQIRAGGALCGLDAAEMGVEDPHL